MSTIKSINVNGQSYSLDNSDVTTSSDSSVDFAIADEAGNEAFVLHNGHIITKNFDSHVGGGVELFMNKFKGKTLGIVGDSISTFSSWLASDVAGFSGTTYAVYYPSGTLTDVTQTWWWKVCDALGINQTTQLINCSWSGSRVSGDSTSLTNAYAACSNKRISDLTLKGFTPDIIICFISCNDWGNPPVVPVGTWKTSDPIPQEGAINELRAAYALMLHKLHTTYPTSRIFCCTNLDDMHRDKTSGWPSNNSNGVSTDEWNQNIIEIARAFGCDIINLHECGINYYNIKTHYGCGSDNGLHPNPDGHTLMARKIIAELFAKY